VPEKPFAEPLPCNRADLHEPRYSREWLSGTVSFSVNGLPTGASASFTPSTVSGQGTTTLNVATASSTLVGSYTLTITGSTGALSHSVTVKLVVNSSADSAFRQALRACRSSETLWELHRLDCGAGRFTGSVSLMVAGVPRRVTASFNPTTVNSSGSSVLTIRVGSRSRAGTYKLTITGTSGNLVHSTSVTLVLK